MISPSALAARRSLHKETVDEDLSLADERRQWEAYSHQLKINESVVAVPEQISGVNCLWLCPQDKTLSTTVLYAHGGGFTAGSSITHRAFCAELAAATDANVLLIDYRLLPESALSAPSDDFVSVYSGLYHSSHYNNTPVFFAGDSSGGALAISSLTRIRDNSDQLPQGCFVFSGAFDATLSSNSMKRNDKSDPILSHAVLQHWQSHFSKDFDFSHPFISPLYASLTDLPPVLLLAGELEVWLDDTTRMYHALREAGSSCEISLYDGMWHVWPMVANIPETNSAFDQVCKFMIENSSIEGSTHYTI